MVYFAIFSCQVLLWTSFLWVSKIINLTKLRRPTATLRGFGLRPVLLRVTILMMEEPPESSDEMLAARLVLRAAQDLVRGAGSEAERRCFEALARRIQMEILQAKGDPDGLARIGPSSNGTSIVRLLLADDKVSRFDLARAILKQWFWPEDSGEPRAAIELPASQAPCRCKLLI